MGVDAVLQGNAIAAVNGEILRRYEEHFSIAAVRLCASHTDRADRYVGQSTVWRVVRRRLCWLVAQGPTLSVSRKGRDYTGRAVAPPSAINRNPHRYRRRSEFRIPISSVARILRCHDSAVRRPVVVVPLKRPSPRRGRAWPSAARRTDVREDVPAAPVHTCEETARCNRSRRFPQLHHVPYPPSPYQEVGQPICGALDGRTPERAPARPSAELWMRPESTVPDDNPTDASRRTGYTAGAAPGRFECDAVSHPDAPASTAQAHAVLHQPARLRPLGQGGRGFARDPASLDDARAPSSSSVRLHRCTV